MANPHDQTYIESIDACKPTTSHADPNVNLHHQRHPNNSTIMNKVNQWARGPSHDLADDNAKASANPAVHSNIKPHKLGLASGAHQKKDDVM